MTEVQIFQQLKLDENETIFKKKTFKNIQNFQWENHLTAFYSLNYKNDKLKAILYLMKHKWSNNVDSIFFHISICTHIKSS